MTSTYCVPVFVLVPATSAGDAEQQVAKTLGPGDLVAGRWAFSDVGDGWHAYDDQGAQGQDRC